MNATSAGQATGGADPATRPLAGVRVVEVGQALAGPLAGVIMANLGADVIKVEKPDGGDDARAWGPPFHGDTSLYFHGQNRDKRSVTLDIKDPGDVELLHRLCEDADILIQNLRPGVVEDLGIGPEAMLARHPRLVYCSIWAFGYQGPMRMKPGFDPLLQAFGAMMSLTGRPDDPPTFCGASINDKATGLFTVVGALAALRHRDRTGQGSIVDTSLLEIASFWVEGQINGYLADGVVPKRHGTAAAVITPYQSFETADRPMVIAAANNRHFARLAEVMGHAEWAADPRFDTPRHRVQNRPALIALMRPVLLTRPRAEWIDALERVGVPSAPVNDVAELVASEQFKAVEIVETLPDNGLKVIGVPLSFNRQRPLSKRGAPSLGEHNEELLGRPAPKAG
ncbi:CoA transferase [Roseomonas sp. NAR14]|uniref:CoA transferase n=1 Tax=Roseomonas acroporae TaxID=2937791 RepID=A0A9X1Y861_9PROT|nr:CoA transferase [Roseomonas acroporae]MCK8783995.1 CoA transferase [Roseomonas acroporae]